MSIISALLGATVAQPIEAVGNVLDKLFTSDEEKLTKEIVLQRLALQPQMVQAEINKIEAAHRSIFVAGWRPFLGWVCGLCVGLYYIPQFILGAYLWVKMCIIAQQLVPYPISAPHLFELVLALLGMSGLRTVEKLTGRSK